MVSDGYNYCAVLDVIYVDMKTYSTVTSNSQIGDHQAQVIRDINDSSD